MISCGEGGFDLESLVQCPEELGIELRSSVRYCSLGSAMEFPDMLQE
jgi:hypothetical protein